jgi:uncharacterized protein YlxP (DUF503 family)
MYTGTLLVDLLLPAETRSLKAKRGVVRPVVTALKRYEVAVAEVGKVELLGRAEIGIAVVSGSLPHLTELLDRCERAVEERPEIELLSVRRRIYGGDD